MSTADDRGVKPAAFAHWTAAPTSNKFADRYRCDNLGHQFRGPVAGRPAIIIYAPLGRFTRARSSHVR
jgi:hypothetical protein